MKNLEIAQIFYHIADILELQQIQWKPQAYRKAARSLETLSESIEDIYQKGGINALKDIPGIGENLAKKIEEYINTNHIKEYEKLKKTLPKGIEEIMHVQGLGPKKALKLSKKLNITSLQQLEKAAHQGSIQKIEGFGEKSEQDILRGIGLVKKSQERMLLGDILPIARDLVKRLQTLKENKQLEISGSLRRMKETVRDIDILAISTNQQKVMKFFTTLPDVKTILAHGKTKSAIVLNNGIQADIRVLPRQSYGAALQYFTGNKDHNIKLRNIAIKKGYKLSEYGIFDTKTNKYICGHNEQEVYKALGLQYIEPELRENTGEIEAAQEGKLPKLVLYNSIKGDLHLHTTWSDGNNTPEEMIQAAIQQGHEYVAITDHSKSEHIANGMTDQRLLKYINELEKLKRKYADKIAVFVGSEVSIKADGSLDYTNNYLKKLDWVVASVHSRFKQNKQDMTRRIIKSIENPYVKCLGHPTGRLINRREPYEVELEKVFSTAKERKVLLEINSTPERLDLKDSHIKKATEYNAKFVINTDSHSKDQLKYIELGVAQARRGWATKNDIINTLSRKKFEKFVKK
ncbi:DNA polymerase/3'-5' exonuclease PolX [Candidatus Woesearchaeota archaeon]|nr:DNA polymerase/3'-5' exonuclease PolX [Candidatus Woesearchaeota archaeon]